MLHINNQKIEGQTMIIFSKNLLKLSTVSSMGIYALGGESSVCPAMEKFSSSLKKESN